MPPTSDKLAADRAASPAQDPDFLARLRRDVVHEAVLRGERLVFHSTWGLFSPREVDEGSRLLVEHLDISPEDDCLDLGCGYGVIGCCMARLAPRGRTLMVDKDFVAVDYAGANGARNGLGNAEAALSNGFSAVGERRFDLIASNLPAKVGKELLYLLLIDARAHLKPGGRLYVVTITGLRRFIERAMGEVFGNYDKVKQGKHYTVALAVRDD
jgi:16S rRNA (guanine1207-N2)-methyltransferase